MNRIPSMELLAFLNWMDENNYFSSLQDETIEEYLLNPNNRDSLRGYVRQFLDSRKHYANTEKGTYELILDYVLQYIKVETMNNYNDYRHNSHVSEHLFVRHLLSEVRHSIFKAEDDHYLFYDIVHIFQESNRLDEESVIDGIRDYLTYANEEDYNMIFLNTSKESSANAINEFFRWLKRTQSINNRLSNIPFSILNNYINDFEMDYFAKYTSVSREQAHDVAMSIRRAFQNRDNISYFNKLTQRYRERTATYKCVFLSTDDSFYKLVENHWSELNKYTGNHLDIFYKPEELRAFGGYSVADELGIRERVKDLPCIYLWKTTLAEGSYIPVSGLKMEELLQLIKNIVDLIVEKKPMDEIIGTGRKSSELLRSQLNKNKDIEKDILENLLHACITLQNNPVMYGNVNEDQKNTQIRDLMRSHYSGPVKIADREHRIEIYDQTFNGFSATGKSLGKLDLLVKLDSLPFCIIEGINILADKQGTHWVRKNLFEHINRLGKYDQNGLERNILLVYAQTDCFDRFYKSLITAITNSPNAFIRESKVDCIEDVPLDSNNALTRLARGRYFYNDSERSLYIYVVQISQGITNK